MRQPALLAFGASALLLAILIGLLGWIGDHAGGPALYVYCAEALRLPMEAIARDYEAAHGQEVMLRFGASQTLLATLEISRQGDLFLPADDSYVALAKEKGLVAEVDGLAVMHAVLIVRPGRAGQIKAWDDLLQPNVKLGLANPDAAAIGKLTRDCLRARGLWTVLEARKPSSLGTVTEVASAVASDLGAVDAGIVWDAVAVQFQMRTPGLAIVRLPELAGAKANVRIAVTTFCQQRDDARRLIAFMRSQDHGAIYFRKFGYAGMNDSTAAK